MLLDMRMWHVGAQRGSARVPAKMVQFVSGVWKDNLSDALAVTRRRGINIDRRIASFNVLPGGLRPAAHASFSAGACIAKRGEG